MKLIIVEDEVIVALSLQKELAMNGFEMVRIVGSGEQCIDAFAADPAEVVLMDISLPGALSGIDTALILQHRYSPKIIFVTGYVDELSKLKMLNIRHAGYFVKPVPFPRLLRTLRELADTEKT